MTGRSAPQGAAEVKDHPPPVGGSDLDAVSPDLVCPTMNAYPHQCPVPWEDHAPAL